MSGDTIDIDKAERTLRGFSFLCVFVLFIAMCAVLNCFIEQYRDEQRVANRRKKNDQSM
jgi:hypothetical protein